MFSKCSGGGSLQKVQVVGGGSFQDGSGGGSFLDGGGGSLQDGGGDGSFQHAGERSLFEAGVVVGGSFTESCIEEGVFVASCGDGALQVPRSFLPLCVWLLMSSEIGYACTAKNVIDARNNATQVHQCDQSRSGFIEFQLPITQRPFSNLESHRLGLGLRCSKQVSIHKK